MAKNKIGLNFKNFEAYAERLDALGGDLEKVTEDALLKTREKITENLKKVTVTGKMPHKGKYASGDTIKSIIDNSQVEWSGTTAEIKVGFDFNISGLDTIMLMYGTPKMKPMAGLKAAIYGTKTKKEIQEIQEKVFSAAIEKKLGG